MTLASEKTLPGDVFYTVKVNIKEPLEAKLARTPEAKLEFKTKQVEKRLTEAQILLQKNDTSPSKHKEVEDRVEQKIEEISESIATLQEEGDVATILATTSKLEPVLQAHKEALESVVATEKESQNKEDVEEDTVATFSFTAQDEVGEVKEINKAEEISENPSKESLADTLLKTVERNLVTVEAQESKALETLNSIDEANNESSSIINISEEATKKINELSEKIIKIENDSKPVSATNTISLDAGTQTLEDIDLFVDAEIQAIGGTLRNDTRALLILEAKLFLETAQNQYQNKLFTEALTTATNGIKIIETFDVTTNIETITDPDGTGTSPSTYPILIGAEAGSALSQNENQKTAE